MVTIFSPYNTETPCRRYDPMTPYCQDNRQHTWKKWNIVYEENRTFKGSKNRL